LTKPTWMQYRWWVWLTATGQTNEQARQEPQCNTDYMSWINARWAEFGKGLLEPKNKQDHKEFDNWLKHNYEKRD